MPKLLVSVRDQIEAAAALEGGADWIDVKEPDQGALGAAAPHTIAAIGELIHSLPSQAAPPWSIALGELGPWHSQAATSSLSTDFRKNEVSHERFSKHDLPTALLQFAQQRLEKSPHFYKLGLAGCRAENWQSTWQTLTTQLAHTDCKSSPVAVVYADHQFAQAPSPEAVLSFAVQLGCQYLLIDTFEKSGKTLFDAWCPGELEAFISRVRQAGLRLVLAGSLNTETIPKAIELAPDIIAVRGAACEQGRRSAVSAKRVLQIKQLLPR